MSWTIKLSTAAERKYRRLDKNTKLRIRKALREMGDLENPTSHRQAKPLLGELKGFYRLRVGDYRVIFAVLWEEKTIAVVNLAPRGDAYKDLA